MTRIGFPLLLLNCIKEPYPAGQLVIFQSFLKPSHQTAAGGPWEWVWARNLAAEDHISGQ